jgi:hypothetical protein
MWLLTVLVDTSDKFSSFLWIIIPDGIVDTDDRLISSQQQRGSFVAIMCIITPEGIVDTYYRLISSQQERVSFVASLNDTAATVEKQQLSTSLESKNTSCE